MERKPKEGPQLQFPGTGIRVKKDTKTRNLEHRRIQAELAHEASLRAANPNPTHPQPAPAPYNPATAVRSFPVYVPKKDFVPPEQPQQPSFQLIDLDKIRRSIDNNLEDLPTNMVAKAQEKEVIRKRFIIAGVLYEATSLDQEVRDIYKGITYKTTNDLFRLLRPENARYYKYRSAFDPLIYRIAASSRSRILRRLQHLNKPSPITNLVKQLAPLVVWITENCGKTTMGSSFLRALWATEGDELAATSLMLYYGIHGNIDKPRHFKSNAEFNFHSIEERNSHIRLSTHYSTLNIRLERVREIALSEQDRRHRTGEEKDLKMLSGLAYKAFYSAAENNGLWISQTPNEYFRIAGAIQKVLKDPDAYIPDLMTPNLNDTFTIDIPIKEVISRASLRTGHTREKGYEHIKLEAGRLYPKGVLINMGFTENHLENGLARAYFTRPRKGVYQLNEGYARLIDEYETAGLLIDHLAGKL